MIYLGIMTYSVDFNTSSVRSSEGNKNKSSWSEEDRRVVNPKTSSLNTHLRRGSEGNKKQFCATMDAIDSALALKAGPWFLDNYSLVDIVFAPFLERVAASIPYYKVCTLTFRFLPSPVALTMHLHRLHA